MSIVGTRPPLISETNLYEPRHKVRLAIKPGITGMWQVSGRSDITDFEEVVRLDREYIENWDIGVDIKILLKTVMVVLRKDLNYEKDGKTLKLAEENTSAVEKELSLAGYFAIVSSDNMTAREAIELYKSRDASEKLFRRKRNEKNYIYRIERIYGGRSIRNEYSSCSCRRKCKKGSLYFSC